MTTISTAALSKIQGNNKVVAAMSYHFDKTANTIHNWIKNKDAMLTTPDAIRIISQETGLSEDEILFVENAVA